jgi:4-diphosphocytidyl-2-C-methyl-D-erythritol kinase
MPPAKINLHLEVLGRREDGYHELRTLMQSVDLRDRLEAEEAAEGVLSLEVVPFGAAPVGEENLVIEAARRLIAAVAPRRGVRFRLEKRIPAGAGLGGGSADAAAALVVLNRLWNCGLGDGELETLAAELGSDVPFFLHGGLALGEGRGEGIVEMADLAETPVLIALPEVHVATRDVYARLGERLTSNPPAGTLDALANGPRGRSDWRRLSNTLEETVVQGWPAVGEALRNLRSTGAIHAALSGSGGASFAVFEDRRAAQRAADMLPGSWFVYVGTTVPRSAARLEALGATDGGER